MAQAPLQAIIFDVDGTLADTEHAHLAAFNTAFAQAGFDWHWDLPLYTRLLNISGGKERMLHYWRQVQPDLRDIDGHGVRDTIDRLHGLKTAAYEAAVLTGAVPLRPGVLKLIEAAHRATQKTRPTGLPTNAAAPGPACFCLRGGGRLGQRPAGRDRCRSGHPHHPQQLHPRARLFWRAAGAAQPAGRGRGAPAGLACRGHARPSPLNGPPCH